MNTHGTSNSTLDTKKQFRTLEKNKKQLLKRNFCLSERTQQKVEVSSRGHSEPGNPTRLNSEAVSEVAVAQVKHFQLFPASPGTKLAPVALGRAVTGPDPAAAGAASFSRRWRVGTARGQGRHRDRDGTGTGSLSLLSPSQTTAGAQCERGAGIELEQGRSPSLLQPSGSVPPKKQGSGSKPRPPYVWDLNRWTALHPKSCLLPNPKGPFRLLPALTSPRGGNLQDHNPNTALKGFIQPQT